MNTGTSTAILTGEPSKAGGRKVIRKAKKFSESGGSPSRRKSLQMLQPVAGSNQTKLVGSDGFIRLANQQSRTPKRKSTCDGRSKPKKVFKSDGGKGFTIFEENSSTSQSSSSQKSSGNDVVDMLTRDEPSEKYWEEMAETRRVALVETLKENEELHTENSRLKEENEKLKVMADQAEYLADVVETLIGKQSTSKDSDAEDGEEEDEVSSRHDQDDDEENDRHGSDCDDDADDVFDEDL